MFGFSLHFSRWGAAVTLFISIASVVGKQVAIVLDGKILSAPVIRTEIPGGRGQITGHFTVAEASRMALLLRSGALPAPLLLVEERTIELTARRRE